MVLRNKEVWGWWSEIYETRKQQKEIMYQKLLNLEKDFFRIACISNREWLACTLHDDFVEGGKSGQLSNKEEVIDGLLTRKEDRIILQNQRKNYSFELRYGLANINYKCVFTKRQS